MWFGGSGILTLLTFALIMLTGGMIIPIVVIGFFIFWIFSVLDILINNNNYNNHKKNNKNNFKL